MAAVATGPNVPRPPIRYPSYNPNQLMGGFISLLLQITQLMMSRFGGGGYGQQPQVGGGYPFNFNQAQPPNPFNYGGVQQRFFA